MSGVLGGVVSSSQAEEPSAKAAALETRSGTTSAEAAPIPTPPPTPTAEAEESAKESLPAGAPTTCPFGTTPLGEADCPFYRCMNNAGNVRKKSQCLHGIHYEITLPKGCACEPRPWLFSWCTSGKCVDGCCK